MILTQGVYLMWELILNMQKFLVLSKKKLGHVHSRDINMGMDQKPSVWISSIYQNMSGQELLEVSLYFKNRVEDWDTRERERERNENNDLTFRKSII